MDIIAIGFTIDKRLQIIVDCRILFSQRLDLTQEIPIKGCQQFFCLIVCIAQFMRMSVNELDRLILQNKLIGSDITQNTFTSLFENYS